MALKNLLVKTVSSRLVKGEILFLPPEYSISIETWREMFRSFNATSKPTKIAQSIIVFGKERGYDLRGTEVCSIKGSIEEDSDGFHADIEFAKTKEGLMALYLLKQMDLRFVPICLDPSGKNGIDYIILVNTPE